MPAPPALRPSPPHDPLKASVLPAQPLARCSAVKQSPWPFPAGLWLPLPFLPSTAPPPDTGTPTAAAAPQSLLASLSHGGQPGRAGKASALHEPWEGEGPCLCVTP